MTIRVTFFVLLFALWLLLSNQHTPLIISLGAASAMLVVWLGSRMQIFGAHLHTPGFYMRLPWQLVWLLGRVVVSCVRVAVTVLRPSLPISPGFTRVPMTQKNDLAKLVHANWITLTPGTLSTCLEDDHIEVHALWAEEGAAEHADLDRRVSMIEGRIEGRKR